MDRCIRASVSPALMVAMKEALEVPVLQALAIMEA
jgi:hypothetical protein